MIDENETYGPKMGIKLSLNQADLVIKRHFNNQSAKCIHHINRGYNNRIYIVQTTTNQEYILRLSGRFWKSCKTESEVAALLYLKARCQHVPVPTVFGYCTDKDRSGIEAEYILMEKIEGEPLDKIWPSLASNEQQSIVDQFGRAVAEIQSISFPMIGSFKFKPTSSQMCLGIGVDPSVDIIDPIKVIEIGESVEFKVGPFETFLDYFRRTCEMEIQSLKQCSFMKLSSDYDLRLERIERFVRGFENVDSIPQGICRTALTNVPFVFTHGDFEPYNILVDKETMKVTGIFDLEFSGSYPIDNEWFSGFSFLSANTSESMILGDQHFEDSELQTMREGFFVAMNKCGARIPKDIPGHIVRAELHYFKGLICPWWLRENRNTIPESHFEDRDNACRKLDAVLSKYGF